MDLFFVAQSKTTGSCLGKSTNTTSGGERQGVRNFVSTKGARPFKDMFGGVKEWVLIVNYKIKDRFI